MDGRLCPQWSAWGFGASLRPLGAARLLMRWLIWSLFPCNQPISMFLLCSLFLSLFPPAPVAFSISSGPCAWRWGMRFGLVSSRRRWRCWCAGGSCGFEGFYWVWRLGFWPGRSRAVLGAGLAVLCPLGWWRRLIWVCPWFLGGLDVCRLVCRDGLRGCAYWFLGRLRVLRGSFGLCWRSLGWRRCWRLARRRFGLFGRCAGCWGLRGLILFPASGWWWRRLIARVTTIRLWLAGLSLR